MSSSAPLATWKFPKPLLPGTLVKRYNRFLAEISLDRGDTITAHCVNTGRMEGIAMPGLRVWVSHEDRASRALKYTWQIVEVDGHLIGANTARPNLLVEQLLAERALPGLRNWKEMRREHRINAHSRCDFWLKEGRREHFIEVKNCHLVYPDHRGYFPDSVSERATKHLGELMELVEAGHRATVIFVVQHPDAKSIRPSDAHDPAMAIAARKAAAAGVKFRAVQVVTTPELITIERTIPVDLKEYKIERMIKWRDANRALAPAWFTVKRRRP